MPVPPGQGLTNSAPRGNQLDRSQDGGQPVSAHRSQQSVSLAVRVMTRNEVFARENLHVGRERRMLGGLVCGISSRPVGSEGPINKRFPPALGDLVWKAREHCFV